MQKALKRLSFFLLISDIQIIPHYNMRSSLPIFPVRFHLRIDNILGGLH